MISLEALDLPAWMVQTILDAGYKNVWDLHASNKYTLRGLTHFSAEDVDIIIAAMRAIGWDFKVPCEDPVGFEEFPSAVALRNLLARLRFSPRTSKLLKYYLMGVSAAPELLDGIEPEDTETMIQLLRLLNVEGI